MDRADVVRTVRALGVVQIDSVNVLVRSHYLPLFSRLGNYAMPLLDEAAYGGRRRQLFEYWGHEASLLPVELQPLLRWRMQRAKNGDGTWGNVARFGREQARFCAEVLAQIRERGPAGRVGDRGGREAPRAAGGGGARARSRWSTCSGRGRSRRTRAADFERIYDLTERVLPRSVIETPTPAPADAQRELLRIAARALGVATERDLRDYFRLSPADAKTRIAELVEAGELRPVQVEGWKGPGYLAARAKRAGEHRRCARCCRRSIRSSGFAIACSGCSTSTTASRSTRRRTSACTATTCCRSCSAIASWRAST